MNIGPTRPTSTNKNTPQGQVYFSNITHPSNSSILQRLELWSKVALKWAPIAVISLLLLGLTAASISLTQQSQDLRKSADEVTAQSELIFVPSEQPWYMNNDSYLTIKLNTGRQTLDGVQVVFELQHTVTDSVKLEVRPPAGLRTAWQKVETTEKGHRISFAVVSSKPVDGYANFQNSDIARISFRTKDDGPVSVVFDTSWTKANLHLENTNVLKQISSLQFKVSSLSAPKAVTVTSVSTPSGEAKGGVSPTPVVKNVIATPSATLSATSSARPIASTSAQQNGSCNTSCQQSDQCAGSLICYQGFCRTGDSPQDKRCGQPKSNVVSQLCNQKCDTNVECGNELTCYAGTCRLPGNLSNSSCQVTSTASSSATVRPTASPTVIPEVTSQSPSLTAMIVRFSVSIGLLVGLGLVGFVGYQLWIDQQQKKNSSNK